MQPYGLLAQGVELIRCPHFVVIRVHPDMVADEPVLFNTYMGRINSVIPRAGVNDKFLLMLPTATARQSAALLGDLCSLVCDYVARQKVGGLALKYFTMKQFPVLTPDDYSDADLDFIVPRVLELTYTATDLEPWARDLGYEGPPFEFDPGRRTELRAELDAYYARLYGIEREAFRFILDPQSAKPDYPSETFSVLKRSEEREFGEYRTARLVLREFDRMALADDAGNPYKSLLVPPPGEQSSSHYSAIGILGSEDDARLAGLILAIIRRAGALPRQDLGLALAAAQTAYDPRLAALRETHYGMLSSARLRRVQTLLQWFERVGAIRVREQGDLIEAVAETATPSGVIVENGFDAIAGILLDITGSSLERQSADGNDKAAPTSSVRHA